MPALFPLVPLGEVLTRSDDIITIDVEKIYREVTVRLWGKGVTQRRVVSGIELKGARRFVAKSGQFIVSRIDARNGAFGLIPDSLDGGIVTTDFPLFKLNPNRVLPAYLNWLSKTKDFVELCRAASEGTTNRVRLQEDRFFKMNIPLPSLDDQRRIVARIEELAAKIEDAKGLREQAVGECDIILESELETIFLKLLEKTEEVQIGGFADVKGGKRLPRGETLWDEPTPFPYIRVADMQNHSVSLAGIKYVPPYLHEGISRYTISSKDVYVTIAGTIGYPGLIPEELDGANLTENAAKLVFRNSQDILKEYIVYALRSPQVQEQFRVKKTTAAQPKLALHRIASTSLPLPARDEQRRIVAYLDGLQSKVDALKRLQEETSKKLDALLPSILDKAFKGELV
jgi:type I restriction enzyme S subunit